MKSIEQQRTTTSVPQGAHVVFYDAVCGLCDASVKMMLGQDKSEALLYAPLQSELARKILTPHGIDPDLLESIVFVSDYGTKSERAWDKMDAIIQSTRLMGYPARASVMSTLPRSVRNTVYMFIARHRYKIFGKTEQCIVPTPEVRRRFIGLDATA